MSQFRRRLMMASGSIAPVVPIFYDYLETTDAYAFIATGVRYDRNAGIRTDITAFPTKDKTYTIPLGVHSASTSQSRLWAMSFTNQNSTGFGFSTARTFGYTFSQSDRKVRMVSNIKNGAQNFEVYHGTSAVRTFTYTYTTTVTLSGELTLFKSRVGSSGTTFDYTAGCRIWGCKIYSAYDSTTLVRDFRPCTYGGVAGMWDMVEDKFYGNANTQGSFSVGND